MTEHLTTDPELLDFLGVRLREAAEAAAAADRPVRGLDLLDEVLAGLHVGVLPDQMCCDLLVVAYADHPAFRPRWNRWREAA